MSSPQARGGHSATMVETNKRVFVFGGSGIDCCHNDLWCYNVGSNSWSIVPTQGAPPCPRYAHSAIMCAETNSLLIWGGTDGVAYFNDMWFLDLRTLHWTHVTAAPGSALPEPRYAHTCHLFRNHVILFGGCDQREAFGDLWVFDQEKRVWSMLRANGDAPSPRAYHTSSLFGHQLFVFGGKGGPDTSTFFNDGHLLTFGDVPHWSKVCLRNPMQPSRPLAGRAYHSANIIDAGFVCIVGGYNGTDMFREALAIDIHGELWFALDHNGSKRCKHTAVVLDEGDCVMVFGGHDGRSFRSDCARLPLVDIRRQRMSLMCDAAVGSASTAATVNGHTGDGDSQSRDSDDEALDDTTEEVAAAVFNGACTALTTLSPDDLGVMTDNQLDGFRYILDHVKRMLKHEQGRRRRHMNPSDDGPGGAASPYDAPRAHGSGPRRHRRATDPSPRRPQRRLRPNEEWTGSRATHANKKGKWAAPSGPAKASDKAVKFGGVSVREYRRRHGGGAAVPDDDGPTLGMDWMWVKQFQRRLSSFEGLRREHRVPRKDYMRKGFVPATKRIRILAKLGTPEGDMQREVAHIKRLREQRKETAQCPDGLAYSHRVAMAYTPPRSAYIDATMSPRRRLREDEDASFDVDYDDDDDGHDDDLEYDELLDANHGDTGACGPDAAHSPLLATDETLDDDCGPVVDHSDHRECATLKEQFMRNEAATTSH